MIQKSQDTYVILKKLRWRPSHLRARQPVRAVLIVAALSFSVEKKENGKIITETTWPVAPNELSFKAGAVADFSMVLSPRLKNKNLNTKLRES